MDILSGITATSEQDLQARDENGNLIQITLYFLPAAQQWNIDIRSGNFELFGNRVCNSPNLLYQYQRIISFGLAVIVSDGGEPFQVNDFENGRAQLGILTRQEVADITAAISQGRTPS